MILFSAFALRFDWFIRADFYFFDAYSLALSATKQPDPAIVVVAIDDYSLEQMSRHAGRWVWPRSVHAELIEGLKQQNINALVFDILFAEKDIYRPDGDAYLNEVVAESNKVFFSMLVLDDSSNQGADVLKLKNYLPLSENGQQPKQERAMLLLPWAITPENWQLGTINYHAELDGISRVYRLQEMVGGWNLSALALEVARRNTSKLPTTQEILLSWRGDTVHPYQTYSYVDLYEAVINNDKTFLAQFDNKTVLIGATAAGLYDARATPINHNLPGVYILATAIDNLTNQNYHQKVSQAYLFTSAIIALFIVTSVFLSNMSYSQRIAVGFGISSLAMCALAVAGFQLMKHNWVVFIGSPILLNTLYFLLCTFECGYQEFLNRKKALSMFGRFLDPKVVLSLLSQGKLAPDSLNKKLPLTILFSDIRGFTKLSEHHSANDVLKLLNDYFTEQVSVVFAQNGTLDKFIGDCIMAFWGAPVANDSQADDAINAALIMQENLIEFKKTLPESLQGFDVGIGIHSGEAIAGLVGTEQRVDYTVIGDAVNLASRIEGLTKQCSRILVSQETKELASNRFKFEYKGEFNVKGREASVKLYQPLRK